MKQRRAVRNESRPLIKREGYETNRRDDKVNIS